MTWFAKKFSSYNPYSGKDKVHITDGSQAPIFGKGSIQYTTLSLTSVLHASKFSSNLLSISKKTKVLKCKVSFYFTHCEFKDLKTKKKIDYGIVEDGLYLLKSGFVGLGNTNGFKHGLMTISNDVNQ
jgi:hypothetical protein